MSLPLMGIILFPLCLIFWMKPARLLEILLIAGIFPAASALTLGGLAVQPSLVPGLAFLSYFFLQKLLGAKYPGETDVMRLCMPMIFATAWALFGSIAMPRLFHNQVLVWPQKQDAVGAQTLLAPSFGNITQDIYLFLNVLLMVCAAQYLTRYQVRLSRLYYAYLIAGWMVVFLCVWQFASRTAGVPFPKTFLYSNTGWAVLDSQVAGPVPRINASFSEPAACATYLVGVLFSTVWVTLKGYRVPRMKPLIAASALSICLTTSTTGFATVAAGALLLPIMVIVTGASRLLGRLGQLGMIAAVLLGIGGLVVATFVPKVVTAAQNVAAGTAEKKDSASYKERSQADADSLTEFFQTYGLGVGWGSNRSSSLIPGLLATVGIIGVAGLMMFDWRVVRAAGQAMQMAPGSADCLVIEGMLAAVLGRLIAAIMSAPTIGMPDFYVMIGTVIAAITRIRLAARNTRQSTAPSAGPTAV
ncbi:hypothetical protein [Acetobacter oeni]|uniref:Uncharacterized protein n=1 Tax=Acetobacter oeni TaxID=304077 RepID=A0A511XHJ0_9PROT|nr:hypothetical protein [Acetobacter oeni]MBB3881259.1 hypothetical protein [Acetobacter oeni]NHO18134.1 hypothetical protein [Acetobacter oeni]GBR08182.1 hypothetical protein AA21952_2540 [Acetobacter oeni LMG 21952]GEN62414.1 hypothetical protein AOE01nite_06380 [Acetobacter oeni]